MAASRPVDQRYHVVGFGILLNDYLLHENARQALLGASISGIPGGW